MNNPSLLDEYSLTLIDFNGEDFHQIVFSCIFNLYNQGVKVFYCFAIDSFLATYDKQYKISNDNKGLDYIVDAKSMCEPDNFEYNYSRVKKFSLLRYYESTGLDTRFIYDSTVIEPKGQEEEQRKIDAMSLVDIIDMVEIRFVIDVKNSYKNDTQTKGQLAGVGLMDLVQMYRKEVEMGFPMQSKFMNSLLYGSRKKSLYLRSGGTGSGKTRLSVADTVYASVPWIYDLKNKQWEYTGLSNPSLIISTELSIEEIQTIILAFVSGVDEEHILHNQYDKGEFERVIQATECIYSSPLYIEYLPDFDIDDIAKIIKKYRREKNIELVNFDYLHTSIKLLIQIASMSKGLKLREDQVLFMFSDALKTLASTLDVHIDSATQLNDKYKDAPEKDQSLIRGSKAIADRIDAGYIALPPDNKELKAIEPILRDGIYPKPNMIYHLYKCRKGKITRVKVWLKVDLGNCRVQDLFVTTFDNELIPVDKMTIEAAEEIIHKHSIETKEIEATEEQQIEAVKSLIVI